MPSLNKVMLMGNLTRDPELRVTPKGTPICQFSLAINRKFKMESGESREEVIFVDIEAWGKQGEAIAKYLVKGRPLFVIQEVVCSNEPVQGTSPSSAKVLPS